jgi:hypothetical protein
MKEALLDAWAEGDTAAAMALADILEEEGTEAGPFRAFAAAGATEHAVRHAAAVGVVDNDWLDRHPWMDESRWRRFVKFVPGWKMTRVTRGADELVFTSGDNETAYATAAKCGLEAVMLRGRVTIKIRRQQRRRFFTNFTSL